jgi:hypothetical protein
MTNQIDMKSELQAMALSEFASKLTMEVGKAEAARMLKIPTFVLSSISGGHPVADTDAYNKALNAARELGAEV